MTWNVPALHCGRGPPWHFEPETCARALNEQLGTHDLQGFGLCGAALAVCAAGALLQYVRDTQKAAVPHIRTLQVEQRGDALMLDAATRRNLELDTSLSGNPDATLFALIDRCVTAMGSRQLRRWLNRTLTDHIPLRQRYQAIAALIDQRRFESLRQPLAGIGDVERILSRVALRSARPPGSGAAAQRHRPAAGSCHRRHRTGRRLAPVERAAATHEPAPGCAPTPDPGAGF